MNTFENKQKFQQKLNKTQMSIKKEAKNKYSISENEKFKG